jgi:hypothetical protein
MIVMRQAQVTTHRPLEPTAVRVVGNQALVGQRQPGRGKLQAVIQVNVEASPHVFPGTWGKTGNLTD